MIADLMHLAVSSSSHRQPPIPPRSEMQTTPFQSTLSKCIDAYNPGVTFLMVVWVAGISIRKYLTDHDQLTQIRYEALTSLIYVVPVMLFGWAVLAWFDRSKART